MSWWSRRSRPTSPTSRSSREPAARGTGTWIAALLVLLGAAGYVTSEAHAARDGAEVAARGTFWSAHNKHGTLLSVRAPASSLSLRPGDTLRLTEPEGDGTTLRSLDLRVARWGEQSSLIDLRFRDRGAVLTRLTVVPGSELVADLTRRTAAGVDEPLASVTRDGLLTDPAAPFDLTLALDGPHISVSVNGEVLLQAESEGPASGRVSLWADGLTVHRVALQGSRVGDDGVALPFSQVEDFGLLAGESGWRLWGRPALSALLAIVLCCTWLACLPRQRPGPRRAVAAGLVALAPLGVLGAVGLVRPLHMLPPGLVPVAGVTLAIVGLVLALPRLPTGPAQPLRGRDRLLSLLVVGALAAWMIDAVGGAAADAARDPLQAAEEAVAQLVEPAVEPAAFTQDEPIDLGPDNALVVPGPYRSAEVRARVGLRPGAVLELRVRGHKTIPAGVALLLSADAAVRTGFVIEDDDLYEPVGTNSGAVPADKEHEVVVTARGTHFVARIGERVVAQADTIAHASGGVYALAAAGTVALRQLSVTPLAPEPAPPTTTSLAAAAVLPVLGGLAALAFLAAALLRRSPVALLASLSFGWVPLALGAPGAETLGRLSYSGFFATWGGFAALLVLTVVVQARAAGGPRLGVPRRAAACLLALLTPALLLTAAFGTPQRADRASKPSYQDFAAPRLAPGLVHFEHPLVRRYNTWLRDHRFRNRSVPLAAPADTVRILCIGSSSTWGHGIPEGKAEDYPAVLGQLLAERELAHRTEVINGAVRGTTAARMLHFFEDVLLEWEPDIVTVSFYFNDSVHLSTFDEQPWFDAITEPGFELDRRTEWRTWQAVEEGRRRVSRLFGAFPSARGDSAAAWRAVRGDAAPDESTPPERFAQILRAYAALCAERGIDLVLIKEPIAGNIDRIWKREFYAVIDAVAREAGAVVVDPTPSLQARGGAALFMDQVHPLPAGHAVVAETLLPVIRRLIWER